LLSRFLLVGFLNNHYWRHLDIELPIGRFLKLKMVSGAGLGWRETVAPSGYRALESFYWSVSDMTFQ
jgi:hypothetical protein